MGSSLSQQLFFFNELLSLKVLFLKYIVIYLFRFLFHLKLFFKLKQNLLSSSKNGNLVSTITHGYFNYNLIFLNLFHKYL